MSYIKGHVHYWNENKGFGFIKTADDRDFFAHISDTNFQVLPVGTAVQFQLGTRNGRVVARSVKPIKEDTA
jgi:cold shock CspA family protein